MTAATTAPSNAPVRAWQPSRPALPGFPATSWVVWLLSLGLLALGVWAHVAMLDEVSSGTGKVVPSRREQEVQSLEGGVLSMLAVKTGDLVQAGQVLAQLDRTRFESTVQESSSRLHAALASAARLRAESSGTALQFPAEVAADAALVAAETALYASHRDSLAANLKGLRAALRLLRSEIDITEPLVAEGAASPVEVLRLKRQASELENRATDLRTQYEVRVREELAKANAEVEAQRSITRGRSDALSRTQLTSPVRGIVKEIFVNTVGGAVPPNGRLLEIIPLDEHLLIEAHISPRDIAFIHPGQAATVKLSAYDYAIYRGLSGHVESISPDTLQDEVRRESYFYRVQIRTDQEVLRNRQGKTFPILPGMVATVDIRTGQKSVLDYLLKPLNKAQEALRER
jgi:adhesin transport system membrane fusion protein